jgi:hypothetical protein
MAAALVLAHPKIALSVVTNITKVVEKIAIKVNEVKINKRQCLILSQSIKRGAEYLKIPEFQEKVYSSTGALLKTLQAFEEFLRECYEYISSFVHMGWIDKFVHTHGQKERFGEYHARLQGFSSELSMGINIKNLISKEQEEEEDQLDSLTFMNDPEELSNNYRNNLIYSQQLLLQQQAEQFNQWAHLTSNKIDRLRAQHQTTAASTVKHDDIFVNGTWSNRYFQFGVWHGPFKHHMTFNSTSNTFEGYGENDVGQFILTGNFSKHANLINIVQSYKVSLFDKFQYSKINMAFF